MFNAFKAFSEASNVTDDERLDKIRQELNRMIYMLVRDIRMSVSESMECGSYEATVFYTVGGFYKFGDKIKNTVRQILLPFISEKVAEKMKILGYSCLINGDRIKITWDQPPEPPVVEFISNDEFVNSVVEHFKVIKDS